METLTFKLQEDNFEGPLDLLLYLVGKNRMNLYDINIMELIEQYTAAIQTMQADKLEVSSEFIDMAAHLVQMKSALLLPRSPEAERMKAELTGRLAFWAGQTDRPELVTPAELAGCFEWKNVPRGDIIVEQL